MNTYFYGIDLKDFKTVLFLTRQLILANLTQKNDQLDLT